MTKVNESRTRDERLGFRLDRQTKALIERAARLERRKVTDFAMSALTEAARRTIAAHDNLTLSDRDRAAFFAALADPPPLHPRLKRALAAHGKRIAG